MRKLIITITLALMLSGFSTAPAPASEQAGEVPVLVDGILVAFDVQPVIRNGRTLVPFRSIAETLNITVAWDGPTQTVSARGDNTDIVGLLTQQLRPAGKMLTLTLHPPNSVYKGYDYQSLGKVADRIIIMAYDYGSRPEPAELVNQAVIMALAAVPPEKLILGVSAPSETPESLITKVGIAKKYKLNGIALWRLGLMSDRMWESLRSTVKPTPRK